MRKSAFKRTRLVSACLAAISSAIAGGAGTASADTAEQAAEYCRFSNTVEGRSLNGELLYSPETNLVHARLKLAFPDAPITGADRAFTDKVVYKSAWIERIGPVTLSFRPQVSLKRPFFRKPRGFSIRGLSADGAGCRSR